MNKKLIIDTPEKAYLKEQPELETIIHNDQEAQYTSNDYCKLIEQLKMKQSMSRRGNCYDNAVIESFHASIKKEMIYLQGVISANIGNFMPKFFSTILLTSDIKFTN